MTFTLPPGSWDSHAHLIDGVDQVAFVEGRDYTPPSADVDEYVAMLDRVGLSYGVVIQISVHGNDNRLIAEALRRYPDRLRGVISVDGRETDDELLALRALGVCGIRINEHFAGGAGADKLSLLAERCARLGWHIDLGLPGQRLLELAPVLRLIDAVLVIDHMGFCPIEQGLECPEFRVVLELARQPNVWTKLSGGYRLSQLGPPYDDVGPFIRSLVHVAPDRTIWASDWPNVAIFERDRLPDTGEQLDAIRVQLTGEVQLRAVLVENPMRLYGRPGAPANNPISGGSR